MIQRYLLGLLICAFSTTGYSQIISTPAGGDWSNPATWVGAVVPGLTDPVTIADGATVTIDINAEALSLSVGQATGASLLFQAAGAVTLTVNTDLTIQSGSIMATAATGTETGHQLSIGGNLFNEGTLDLSTNNNQVSAELIFTGAGNAQFSGNGPVSDISLLTINKGNSAASILELSPSSFSFSGAINTPATSPGYLNIINGMIKIAGTFTMSNGLFTGTTNYTIPPSGGLWMANPNYTVLGRNGTAYNEGTLIMDAGVLNVGNSTGNRLGYIAGSVVIINGGEINVASRFTATTTFGLTYTQTGGTITLNTVENPRELFASFDIRPIDNSSFTMSGGKIVLQNANISGQGPRDYNVEAQNMNITGGTLQIGNAATTGSRTYFIQGFAPNIEIGTEGGPVNIYLLNNTTVLDSKIGAGSVLHLHDDTTGFAYTQKGGLFQNDGTIDGSFANSSLVFSGELSQAQVYSGSGNIVNPLSSLQLNNVLPVTFSNSNAQDIVVNTLAMTAGDINNGNNTLVLGTSASSTGTLNYTSGRITGAFRRWVSNSTATWNFPVGVPGFTRLATIDFTSAPAGGGTITASFVSQPGGFNGLPLTEGLNTILNTSSDGFWRMIAADGLSGGTYTGTFEANGFSTITDYTRLVLVKRDDASSPWVLNGTPVATSGSNALAVLSRTGMTGLSADFAPGGDLIALPVTIEYLRGKNQGDAHWLQWKVSCTQTPGVRMILQHSTDTRVFKNIYDLYATAAECNQPFETLNRNTSPGLNYYRVRTEDADGKVLFSSIVALTAGKGGFMITGVQPNPAPANAILQVAASESGSMQVLITDKLGRVMSRRTVQLIPGYNPVNLPVDKLAPGSYQVTGITEKGRRETVIFIKQ